MSDSLFYIWLEEYADNALIEPVYNATTLA